MQHRSFTLNIIYTGITQFIILVIGVFVLKLLANHISEEGMGAYLIIRRFIGLAFPVITLNLSISIARHIQYHKDQANDYLKISIIITTLLMGIIAAFFIIFSNYFTKLLFGNIEYKELIFPMISLLFVSSLQPLFGGYYRGQQRFTLMNVSNLLFWCIQIGSLGYLLGIDKWMMLVSRFLVIASGLILISLVIQYIIIIRSRYFNIDIKNIDQYLRFIKYGIMRLPNGFFLAGIFFFPVFITTKTLSLTQAAYIGIIVSIIRIIYQIGVPFNLVVLPKFSEYDALSRKDLITGRVQLIVEFIVTYAILAGVFVYLFSSEIIFLWFGDKYLTVIQYLNIVAPSVGALICYVLFRGVIDGLYVKPYTIFITFAGFAVVLTGSVFASIAGNPLHGYTIAFTCGVFALGIGSLIVIRRMQGVGLLSIKNLFAILWVILLFMITKQINQLISGNIIKILSIKTVFALLIMVVSYYYYQLIGFNNLRFKNISFKGM